MNSFAASVVALVLALPAAPTAMVPTAHEAPSIPDVPAFGPSRSEPSAFRNFRESYRPDEQDQVRIEQHVIIRINPGSARVREEMFGPPLPPDPPRFKEKKADHCVPIGDIAGITPMQPNRLVLFMRDHRLLGASLEKACDADAFYLGAYVERSPDGMLCTGRDTLRSRTGATCQISRFTRLVAKKD